jgi:hypothetical protein
MNALVMIWTLAAVFGAALILQHALVRNAHRRRLARQQARHQQVQQTMNQQLEQTKRQIGQLQNDLAAARTQLRQLGAGDAGSAQGRSNARQALEREMDDAPASRFPLPADGFADTQPLPPDTRSASLLLQ